MQNALNEQIDKLDKVMLQQVYAEQICCKLLILSARCKFVICSLHQAESNLWIKSLGNQLACIKPFDNLQQTCYNQTGVSDANTLESLSKRRFCQHGRQPEVSCVVIDGE